MTYTTNLVLKYQNTNLQEFIKEELAKQKVQQIRNGLHGKEKMRTKIDEGLRLKLENDRFKEKIAALKHALFKVKL